MIHTEALTEKGKELFPLLTEFSDFYLAGGTALALLLGHRVSVDFDFFSDAKIKRTLLARAEKVFSKHERRVLVTNSDELTLLVDGVKLTFLFYPFPVLLPKTDINGIPALSIKEIGATKAYTIGRRGMFKDYVDMHAIVSGGHSSLAEIMKLAREKYANVFDERLFLEQLAYFGDLEEAPILFLNRSVSMSEIAGFFAEEIKKIEI